MLAARLGWSAASRTQMIDEYRAEVALSRRWRQGERQRAVSV
jgi:hypothetical protein